MGWGFEIFKKNCRQIPVNCDQISPSLVAIAVKYPNARPKKGTIKISSSKTQKQERGGVGGGRNVVWDRETMFSQLAKRSSCVVVSG